MVLHGDPRHLQADTEYIRRAEYRKDQKRVHCTKNPIYVLPEMKLCGLFPNSYIHVSVSDLYIPWGWSAYLAAGRLILGIYKSLTDT